MQPQGSHRVSTSCLARRYVSRNTKNRQKELLFIRWWPPAQKPQNLMGITLEFWQRMSCDMSHKKTFIKQTEDANVATWAPRQQFFPSRYIAVVRQIPDLSASLALSSWKGVQCPAVVRGAISNPEAESFFYINRLMMKVGRECESMFRLGKRRLHAQSPHYLAKWPCSNILSLHLNFPIFTLH